MLEGIDVSDHNGTINWPQVRKAGIAFAMCKAAEGSGFHATSYERNRVQAQAAGILVSPYHFYHHDQDPLAQARFFASITGRIPQGMLQPACDIEMPRDGAGPMNYGHAEATRRIGIYLGAVKSLTGRDPIIYSYPDAWLNTTGDTHAFAGVYPVWPASYRVGSPKLFGGATAWTFWQYTASGWLNGVGAVDRDRFFGDINTLRKFAGF